MKIVKIILLSACSAMLFTGLVLYRSHLLEEPYTRGWNILEQTYFYSLGFLAMVPVGFILDLTFADDVPTFILSFTVWFILSFLAFILFKIYNMKKAKA